jgi:hypothetical protein
VHQVHRQPADVRAQVGQLVQPGLEPGDVKGCPVGKQFREPEPWHTPLPSLGAGREQPTAAKPFPQLLQRVRVQ